MEIHSYNAELAHANIMFKRLFNNIILERFAGSEKIKIPVNCMLGQRSRILKNLQNPEKMGTIKLPLIIVNRTGYTRNAERLNNLHNEVKYELNGQKRPVNLLSPIPIDISYDVSITSKFPSDIDKIASNFMVFFNSDVYVSCVHPKFEGLKLYNQVVMQDSITEEHPDELEGTADDYITSTFQFIFKTYLFGGDQKSVIYRPIEYTLSTTTVLSSVLDTNTVFRQDLPSWLDIHTENPLSILLEKTISVEVSSMISSYTSADLSSGPIYNGFTPLIKTVNMGFYPVPYAEDYDAYMSKVDGYVDQDPYVDRLSWTIGDDDRGN